MTTGSGRAIRTEDITDNCVSAEREIVPAGGRANNRGTRRTVADDWGGVSYDRARATRGNGDVRRTNDLAARDWLAEIENHAVCNTTRAGDNYLAGIGRQIGPKRSVRISTAAGELAGVKQAAGGNQRHMVPTNVAGQGVIVPTHE